MISQTKQTAYRLSNLDAQQQKITYQMSTKKELQNGSDDSVLYSRVISVDDKIRTYEGLQSQVEKTTVQNNTSDSSLKDIKKLLEFVKQELVKANTDTTTTDGIAAIASSIAGIKENLYQLANTQVEGEYLFSGSDSSVKPFEKDPTTGKVTYNGNNQLQRIAVEEGSYRQKGVTGFDMMMYPSSTAYKGQTLVFNESDRIVDQDRNEWKMRTPIAKSGEDLTFPASTTTSNPTKLIDGNNTIWTLDTTVPLSPVLKDSSGNNIPLTYDAATSLYKVNVPTSSVDMGINELVKFSSTGSLVTPEEILVPTVGTTGREIVAPAVDGTKFEAKTNIFDFIDNTVNALKKVDSAGNQISDVESKALISESLSNVDKAFDGVNIAHADLGGKNQVFQFSLERISSKLTQYNVLSEEIGGADLTKVAMEAKALELTYTALYSTISKTNQLSLVNFLN
jgi:flagellar hook-associated protein 3 FlgL